MKLQTQTGTAETSGLEEVQDFSIAVNGKAFKILLDGLYSDKVGAIIRELSTNAYDAHLAIGAGAKPFLVELPTLFNPIFRVRDYGVSMTHERVMKLLSTVFGSSKDESNTQVGAFGLGSKSPFALVDSYTIIAWMKGEKRTYNAFYNPDGTPTLAFLGREKSDEPTGVEFSMTVDPKHVSAFKQKATTILQWFPTHPTIVEESIRLVYPEVYAEGKGWKLLKTVGGQSASDFARARQGCVVYPISADPISGLSDYHRALIQSPLLLDFPIGSLEVVASREALEYKQQTCRNIVARLNSVAHEITEFYGKAIRDAPTLWAAGKAQNELVKQSKLPRALTNLIATTKWNGTTEVGHVDLRTIQATLAAGATPIQYSMLFWDAYRLRRSTTTVYMDSSAQTNAYRVRLRHGEDIKVYFTMKDARPTHEAKRIRTDCGAGMTILFVVEDQAHQQIILDKLGNPPDAKWTKDLPEPVIAPRAPRASRGVTKKVEVRVREYVNTTPKHYGTGEYSAEKIVQLTGDAYYVVTADGMAVELGRAKDRTANLSNGLLRACFAARDAGIIDPNVPIYLVSTVYAKRVVTCPTWKPLGAVVLQHEADLTKKAMAEAEAVALHHSLNSNAWVQHLRRSAFRTPATHTPGGPLAKLQDAVVAAGFSLTGTNKQPDQTTMQHVENLYVMGIDYRDIRRKAQNADAVTGVGKTIAALTKACDDAYPMIAAASFNFFNSGQNAKAFTEYVEAIDTLRAAKKAAAITAAAQTTPQPTLLRA